MYNQAIRVWWPKNIIEKLKVAAGYSCLSKLDNRVIVKVTSSKTTRRQCCNCLKVEHCIVEIHLNSFHLYSSKKLLFKEVPCYTDVAGRPRQVAMCRWFAGDCREVCRGNVTLAPVGSPAKPGEHSVITSPWLELESEVVIVVEICSYEVMVKSPNHVIIQNKTNRLIMMPKYSEVQSIWWLLVDIRWLSEKYVVSNWVEYFAGCNL